MAVMKEYPDSVMLYMSNYRLSDDNNLTEAENVEDTVRIYGIVEEPVVTWFDRAAHRASEIKQIWKDGVLTLVVAHNGPVEITVKGKGEATDRQTEWTKARIEVPEIPSVYTGLCNMKLSFLTTRISGHAVLTVIITAVLVTKVRDTWRWEQAVRPPFVIP